MSATPPGQSSPRPEHASKLHHLTYDTTRTGCMLGSLARGDPGRRFFLLGRRGSSSTWMDMNLVFFCASAGTHGLKLKPGFGVHCGCLGRGETMPVVGVEGNGSRMLIVFHMLLLLFSSRALIDVRAVLRDPSKAACLTNPVTSRQGSYCDLVMCRRACLLACPAVAPIILGGVVLLSLVLQSQLRQAA